MELTPAAKTLLNNRYLLEKETPDDLFRRVATAVDTPRSEDFLHVMKELLFVPNSPGFGAGGIFPVASAVIGDTFPPEKRGSALGLIGAVFGLAFIIGPLMGGIILWLASWRWLFAINLPIALGILLVAPPLLPHQPALNRLPFDWAGMLTLSLILGGLTFGLNRIDTNHFGASLTHLQVWLPLLLALVLLPLFLWLERRNADPILNLRLFKSRQIVIASFLSIGASLGETGVVFIPALAIAALGVSKSGSSFLLNAPRPRARRGRAR